ncbi:MAG: glycosyltransferase [Mycobacteriales bacterium]
MAVFSPSASIGGVELVAQHVRAALAGASGGGGRLHAGLREIVRSPRPQGTWMGLTWKTQALVELRHPGLPHHGLLWLHGAELTRDGSRAHAALRSRTLAGAGALLAVSPLVPRLLPAGLRDRVQLIGPPVPTAQHATARPVNRRQRGKALRLLSVGRAVPRKGHDVAIEVAALLARETAVRLDVVGPGPDLPRLTALADERSRPGLAVHVHGALSEVAKDQLYADADALLFLPRAEAGEYEGLGLVVLEAAARGCPAVVLDCGGSRYGVVDGRTGRLLPAQATAHEVAAAVGALVTSQHAREDAARYAASFSLESWQQRVRSVAQGQQPDWRWPSLA